MLAAPKAFVSRPNSPSPPEPMKTHTPGPWFVVPDPQWEGKHPNHASRYVCNVPQFAEVHPPVEGENSDWNIFHDQHGKTVCLMTDTLEITANANLIASAPDLLAALELIYSNAGESPEWIRSRIGPVIAKAKGL